MAIRRCLILLVITTSILDKGTGMSLPPPPRFAQTPDWPQSNYYEEDGPPIRLDCLLKAGSQAVMVWYRDNVELSNVVGELSLSNQNQTLTLLDPKPDQTGYYSCVAGNVSHSGFIFVSEREQITRPRVVETKPQNAVTRALVGAAVNISCVFDVGGTDIALMQLTMEWFKNASLVEDSNHTTWENSVNSDNNQVFTLSLDKLQLSDYGSYMCLGRNKKGNDSTVVSILPPEPPTKKFPWIQVLSASVSGLVVMVIVAIGMAIYVRRKRKYNELEWEEPDLENYNVPDYKLEYDVFVSYSSQDDEWVRTVLFQNLIQQKYSVCVDFKDFKPGMAVAENILDAIYKSRKTLVLMSQNFLKSVWGQFELQQVLNRAVMQRKDVLVLIKFDKCKIPTKLMGTTFLDWTDKNVKPHFWTRLQEALGEPQDFETDEDMQEVLNKLNEQERNTEQLEKTNQDQIIYTTNDINDNMNNDELYVETVDKEANKNEPQQDLV